jgi:AAA ATPase domain
MNTHQPVNPYIAGSPVTGTEMFFGREDVFSFIRRNLIGQHRDTPVVLYGQRRTGKTSILYQLHRHLDPRYRCIFVDLHGFDLRGMGNLLLGIANSISRGLRREYQLTAEVPDRTVFLADPRSQFENTFLDAVWSVLGEDHLVLMLDEVVRLDEEVKAGRLEREVFDYLRHLMQHNTRLNFLFSLGSGLEEMKKDYAFMFSVALYHRISFLEPDAARELITQPVRDQYHVTPQAVEKILQITSGHPYYTQLVCHCLFDLWSRSPKPVMDAADVDAVLAEAIELGSANLTYAWEDSTPEERALMAGMAAAMQDGTSQVTMDHVRAAWRELAVSLPEREFAQAQRSLIAREIVSSGTANSFTVDLQRLWLEKHRRIDWVKEELAETVQQWNRSVRRTRRGRYLPIAAATVLLVGYLTAAAVAHVFPFPTSNSSSAQEFTTQLLQLFSGDVNGDDCHAAPPPQWHMPGLVQALHCADNPGLPAGSVYAYQLDTARDYEKAWQNFNTWWKFHPASKTCPPSAGAAQGRVSIGLAELQECGPLTLSAGDTGPAYAWEIPNTYTFVIAEARSGSSFSALVSWLTHQTSTRPTLAAGVAPLVELLPGDIDDPAIQCQPYPSPDWATPGQVKSYECVDPGLQGNNYDLFAFQFSSYVNYVTSWQAFNEVINFNSISKGSSCPPPSGDAAGTTEWKDQYFPYRVGQVLECGTVGSGSSAQPEYIWSFPTENAFVWARGGPGQSMSTLNIWWENNPQLNRPTPSP